MEELYRRHAGPVLRAASRLTHCTCAAEDILQDIFLRLSREPHRFDPARGSLRALLVTMARGRAIDLLRSEAARTARHARVAAAVATRNAEDEAIRRFTAGEVRNALHGLRPEVRQALALAYFGGLTYREVALQLGVPEGTAKGRIRAGLLEMREQLEPSGRP